MEATQNLAVPHTATPAKSRAKRRRIRATFRERVRFGAFGGALVLISLLIWISPHAMDSIGLIELLWSRPPTLGYLALGGAILYCTITNVPYKKEPYNPFAARH